MKCTQVVGVLFAPSLFYGAAAMTNASFTVPINYCVDSDPRAINHGELRDETASHLQDAYAKLDEKPQNGRTETIVASGSMTVQAGGPLYLRHLSLPELGCGLDHQ